MTESAPFAIRVSLDGCDASTEVVLVGVKESEWEFALRMMREVNAAATSGCHPKLLVERGFR